MVNIRMWVRALRRIPRLANTQWGRLDWVSRWLIATRAAVLVMTFTSAGVAGILAWRDRAFEVGPWLLVTMGLLLAHATNNLLNDLIDTLKGVDKDNYFRTQYGAQPIEHGLLSKGQVLAYATITGAIAVGCGLALVMMRGRPVLVVFALGCFFVLFYTWPLKYIGLGEPAVVVVWGPLMIGGGYYAITGSYHAPLLWLATSWALAPTAVLFGKHIDKAPADREKGVRTLPVLLGQRTSRAVVLAMLLAQQAIVVALVATGAYGPPLLCTLFALPSFKRVWQAFRQPRPKQPPPELPPRVWPLWYAAVAFWYTRRVAALFLLGLIGEALMMRLRC